MDFDQDFTVIEKAGFCIVLNSKEGEYLLNQDAELFTSKSSNLLVYAESININSSIKIPGRTLGLFCQTLTLTPSGSEDFIIIDVSGANGGRSTAAPVGSGSKGEDGKDAGSVYISVENAMADLSQLKVRALGGDGGIGGSTSDSDKEAQGGAGGKGGNAGKVMLLFNNRIHDVRSEFRRTLRQAKSASWRDKCSLINDVLKNEQSSIDSAASVAFLALFGSFFSSSTSKLSAQQLLQNLQETPKQFHELEIYSATVCFLKNNQSVSDLVSQLDKFLSNSADEAITSCSDELYVQEDAAKENLNKKIQIAPGRGGRGGSGSSDLNPVGARGADGITITKGSSTQCRYIPGPGDEIDVELWYPTFFPDQARMLLKRADMQFFLNTSISLAVAKQLYQRLVRRLFFAPSFAAPANSSSPIFQVFRTSFEKNLISISPFSELIGVLEEARTRLARIDLGQDIFGQGSDWAPRLSYFYYEKRIAELIGNYKVLVSHLNKYKAKSEQSDHKREVVANVRDMVNKEGASVQSRLESILDENGPLRASAYRIRTFDPLMKEQQRHLKEQLAIVANQIQSSINVSKVIDAFTTVASSSGKADTAKNAAKAGYLLYQSYTVVEDADGQSIEKDLLIKQVTTCGDTIESLQDAISANNDGSVALEDLAAVKVVTTNESISKMLNQFKNILPEYTRNAINKQLEVFLETVKSRNSAVLVYNSLSHLIQELRSIKKQQAAMIDALSEQHLQKVDPGLPSIVNWLRRTRDDLALTIMQRLNSASRAICYWGLFEGLPLNEPGPLRDALDLEQINWKLNSNFEKCLNDYAGSAWSSWGRKDSQGRLYKLSPEELKQLKKAAHKDDKGKAVYSTSIMLLPESPGMVGIGSNVRIRQIRLWLTNAHVDAAADGTKRRILTITLTHTGIESIQKSESKTFIFEHSPVNISFRYHCDRVHRLQDATTKVVDGQQIIENDYQNPKVSNEDASSMAPLGPFTLWNATVRERDNPGLDMSKVDGAWLEFWGRSKPM